jgi:hypothetical protein
MSQEASKQARKQVEREEQSKLFSNSPRSYHHIIIGQAEQGLELYPSRDQGLAVVDLIDKISNYYCIIDLCTACTIATIATQAKIRQSKSLLRGQISTTS